MALSVLNLLNERPMHPYEMRLLIRERGHDRAFKIRESSVYDTVNRLADRGFIEPVEVSREGGGPSAPCTRSPRRARKIVAGADVGREAARVRGRIGYVGQLGGADANATGRENLLLAGRLYGLGAAAARQRAAELLATFELTALAGRAVRTYPGGQRRRLEVALGIMHRPRVLFLDEPTTGLDPAEPHQPVGQLRQLRDLGHLNRRMYYAVQAARDLAAGGIGTQAVGLGFAVTGATAGLALYWGHPGLPAGDGVTRRAGARAGGPARGWRGNRA